VHVKKKEKNEKRARDETLSAGNEGNERQHQAETTASNIVHLMEDKTGDQEKFDEAMAHRLQHKYNKEAASSQPFVPHPQHLFHAGTITRTTKP
jgi:hypothetical protein